MNDPRNDWLALDVGGANLKGAHSIGKASSVFFPLWKFPERLPIEIQKLAEAFPPAHHVAVTMTAELCDCYETKRDGVNKIVDALEQALAGRRIWVWGVDGRFHSVETIRRDPLIAAASNWLALATAVARRFPDQSGLLIDIGSTTTDLIPFQMGKVVARGTNDLERLQTGELVYAGVGRTPLCALATQVDFQGKKTGLAAELFATTKDLYLTFGSIAEDPDDRETADNRPSTRQYARARLARMVGADRESFSEADALAFSQELDQALMVRLMEAGVSAISSFPELVTVAVISGAGEFLARRLAEKLFTGEWFIESLEDVWGTDVSTAACARALLELSLDSRFFPPNAFPVQE